MSKTDRDVAGNLRRGSDLCSPVKLIFTESLVEMLSLL